MTETLANGYSSESTQQELSNEYQHDRFQMVFKNLCILVILTEVALALKGLNIPWRDETRQTVAAVINGLDTYSIVCPTCPVVYQTRIPAGY